jgi:hypothetical protein
MELATVSKIVLSAKESNSSMKMGLWPPSDKTDKTREAHSFTDIQPTKTLKSSKVSYFTDPQAYLVKTMISPMQEKWSNRAVAWFGWSCYFYSIIVVFNRNTIIEGAAKVPKSELNKAWDHVKFIWYSAEGRGLVVWRNRTCGVKKWPRNVQEPSQATCIESFSPTLTDNMKILVDGFIMVFAFCECNDLSF